MERRQRSLGSWTIFGLGSSPEPGIGRRSRLGDEAYRLDSANADGAAVTILGWRRANLVMIVIGTSYPASSVEDLGRLIDGRAAGIG